MIEVRSHFTDLIEELLESYQVFTSSILQQDLSIFKWSKLEKLIAVAQTQNLCTDFLQLNDQDSIKSLSTCEQLLDGALRKGLTITLQTFIEQVRNEYISTSFNQSHRVPNQLTEQ